MKPTFQDTRQLIHYMDYYNLCECNFLNTSKLNRIMLTTTEIDIVILDKEVIQEITYDGEHCIYMPYEPEDLFGAYKYKLSWVDKSDAVDADICEELNMILLKDLPRSVRVYID